MKMSAKTVQSLPRVAEVLRTAQRITVYDVVRTAEKLPTVATLRNHNLVEDVGMPWGYSEGEDDTICGLVVYVGVKWRG